VCVCARARVCVCVCVGKNIINNTNYAFPNIKEVF